MQAQEKRAIATVAAVVVSTFTVFGAAVTTLGAVVVSATGGGGSMAYTYGILAAGAAICAALVVVATRAR